MFSEPAGRRFLSFLLLLTGTTWAATGAATSGVTAGARIPNGSWVTQAVERPAAPLVAEATAGALPTAAWASVQPGRMRARAACGPAVGEYLNSMAYADNVEHFHLHRPGLPDNTPGDFLYNMYLTGTMKILATGIQSYASVTVYANSEYYGSGSGQLSFYRFGTQGWLYAATDPNGGSYPETNMFAGEDGALKVYGIVNTPVGGYYTIQVRVPARFVFRDFPCNQSPSVDDWYNRIELGLMCTAMVGATSDFSSTFEFTAQNPIVPDPADTSLPPDGWTITTGSGELTLPPPLGLACATGTGEAFFCAGDGQIANLTALDGSTLPSAGRPATGFADGFFSFDVTGLATGDTTTVTATLPGNLAPGMHWWFPQGSSWSGLDVDDDDGDRVVVMTLIDGGPGDAGGADGVIHVTGGLSPETPQAVWLASFTARARDRGVDLAWRTAPARAESFALTARRGGSAWPVAVVSEGDDSFMARDENVALAAGGRVTYELRHEGDLVGDTTVDFAAPPAVAVLWGAVPNPFNPGTRISFTVPHAQRVRVGVYDLAGRLVTDLADADYGPGDHALAWDGCDDAGRPMPSGTYAVRLWTEQRLQSRLMTLVR